MFFCVLVGPLLLRGILSVFIIVKTMFRVLKEILVLLFLRD